MRKCIKEGMDSFNKNKVKYKNPYKKGSAEYNDYERGWVQALKRTPNQYFTIVN